MKLTINFEELNDALKKNVSKRYSNFSVDLNCINYESIYRSTTDVQPLTNDDELSLRGELLHYDGHGVIVYIKEQSDLQKAIADPFKDGKRYHLTNCKVVREEKEQGRFGRFVALRYLSKEMPVSDDKGNINNAELVVCGACLRELNYQPYLGSSDRQKKKIQREFDLANYLEEHHSYPAEYLPFRHAEFSSFAYTEDWYAVREAYKMSRDYCCEQCGVSLNDWRKLLHTHHIDGVKSNNHPANLMALCVECHSKQSRHNHLKPRKKVRQYLNEQRKAQGLLI